MTNTDHTVLGYLEDGNLLSIPNSIRQNFTIFGEIGSGKSSILRLMILQDIQKGRGFLLAENHSELSKEILSLIPLEQYDKIVYINLSSLRLWGNTLRFNPLQCEEIHDSGMVALTFTECLARAFADSWGARVDTCARNGALATIGTSSPTIGVMMNLLTDQNFREAFIPNIINKHAKEFFVNVYDTQYPKEAGGVVFNKLNKMMTIPEMDAMFNTKESSISFDQMIDDGMYVVLDFGGGLPNDMVKFLGNVFMHLFYTSYKKRKKNSDGTYDKFSLYLDEVQTFSANMIRELLNTVRKYGITMAVATQSISALDKDLADEITTLCRAIACFRCDAKTATHLKAILPTSVELQQKMSLHTFSFYTGGANPSKAVAHTRHMRIPSRWNEAAKHSVEKFGKFVSLDNYYGQAGGAAEVLLSPLEFGILNYLRMQNRDVTRQEITNVMTRRYATDARTVASALTNTLISSYNFVIKNDIMSDDGDDKFESRYSITKTAYKMIFSKAAAGRRAGGDLHLAVIFMIMDIQMNLGHYCVPDNGAGSAKQADLIVFTPEKIKNERGVDVAYSPTNWSEKVMAIEVETAPGKHWDQVIINFEKNKKRGFFVWFIVFTQLEKNRLVNTFSDADINPDDYSVTVMNKGVVLAVNSDSENIRQFTQIQSTVFSTIMNAGGSATEQYIIDNAWRHDPKQVVEQLHKFENSQDLVCEEQLRQNQSNPDDADDKKMVKIWQFVGYSEKDNLGKKNSQVDSSPQNQFSVEKPRPAPHQQPSLPEDDCHVDSNEEKKENDPPDQYTDLTEDMLLSLFKNHDKNDDHEGADRLKEVLKSRGFCIKKRGGSAFLAKLPNT